jgi:signal peptidase I
VRVARRIGLAMIILTLAAMISAGVWLWHCGYRAYVVHTGSMSPNYKPGSLVIDGPAKGNYRPGQVITFRHSAQSTDVVTHRITDITSTGIVHTKGDANASADVWDIRPDQVTGSVLAGIPFAGYVVVYLQQPAGVASVVTSLIGLILLWGLCFPAQVETDERPAAGRWGQLFVRSRPRGPVSATSTAALAVTGLLTINLTIAGAVIAHHAAPSESPSAAPIAATRP